MKRGRTSAWLRVPVIIVALLTVWVWQRITVVKMIRNNDLLRSEVQAKNEIKDKVAAEISRLVQQGRIERIATETLGLAPTRPGQQRMFLPREYQPDQLEVDGWQRLNNSLRRLTVASISQAGEDNGTP